MQLLGTHELSDLRCWIIEVAGDDGLLWTDHDAGGLQPDLDPVDAVVALLGGVVIWVDVQRVVWAGLHATLATDASIRVEVDNPI